MNSAPSYEPINPPSCPAPGLFRRQREEWMAGLAPYEDVGRIRWQDGEARPGKRAVPEETAVALTYNRLSFAVMMATPADLEDFAIGFSITERIVEDAGEIEDLAIVTVPDHGVELRMWVEENRMAALAARRRRLAGATGCGLCGIESLAEAMRPPPTVIGGGRFTASALRGAVDALGRAQSLNARTHAVHAAGFWHPDAAPMIVREDVGRHNAVDKLAERSRGRGSPRDGAIILTSRVSIELVQKIAVLGAAVLVAVSAPTALALRTAEAAGLTVVGVARPDGFEVFTHPERIALTTR